ncbi:MAG: iron-sulfur cluster-binding domain-containing protein [Bacilli bacterium]|nr:iron-sulfur cluster-binding domain-containing protein [Bacilli bacterium]
MSNGKETQKLAKYSLDRTKCIKESSHKPFKKDYRANQVSFELHPSSLVVQVKEIKVESPHVKTFVLISEREFPPFQEGQYITVDVPIEEVIYTRPYTISCSSKRIHDHEIQITVEKVEHGIVSNYFFYQVDIGDYFTIHGPFGQFTYQSLRDAHEVLAIASGSGIIPFKAMAEGIREGQIDFHLTILYEAKCENDLIFQHEFDEIVKKCDKIKIIYVLSEEQKDGYVSGIISKELILEYQKEKMSYFVCGPTELYERMNLVLKELNIANKYIRHDLYDECEKGHLNETYEIRVLTDGQEKILFGNGTESISKTLEREGIIAPKRCGVGVCGICRSKLVEGQVLSNDHYLRAIDKEYHYIHPCVSYPLSNIKIKLPK